MFKKLKIRFITQSMIMLTVVFIGIFGAIYFLIANETEHQMQFTMDQMMFSPPRPMPENKEAISSLMIDTDSKGMVQASFSYVSFEKDLIQEVASKVHAMTQSSGKITVNDNSYAFVKKNIPTGTRIVILDRAPILKNLSNLLMAFFWVGGGSLLILFAFSVYFANKSVRPIQEAFEKQQQFVADASHELRTPLTIIKTYLALLSEKSDESERQWLSGIEREADNMSILVTDMLNLAKLDYCDERLNVEISISKLLETSLLSYEAVFFEHDITLKSDLTQGIMLSCDPEALRRLIVILLDNAVKYTPPYGIVSIGLKIEQYKKLVLEIRNTGIGIPEDCLESIFDRFVRLDDSRTKDTGGYGLGLAIARSIAEKHGGQLTATSVYGAWTQMTLVLPLHK